MAYYSKLYRIAYKNFEEVGITIDIGKKSDISITPVSPQIIEMEGGGSPLNISIVDNDEYKFKPIKGKKATFQFNSTSTINLTTFATGDDDEFYVEIYNGAAQFLFKGYLIVGECSEDYEDEPNVVTLIATDNLGLLKDLPLTDFNGANPRGKYSLIKLLAMALSKTGLDLPIRVINNIREPYSYFKRKTTFAASDNSILMPSSVSDYWNIGDEIIISGTASNNGVYTVQSKTANKVIFTQPLVDESVVLTTFTIAQYHLYSSLFLDAKTFEQEIGESENCYTVIEKILGEMCTMEQIGGEWWIKRVAEFRDYNCKYVQFDNEGEYTGEGTIGQGFIIQHTQPETLPFFIKGSVVSIEGKCQEIKEIYNYDYPKEIIDNIDFDRGGLLTTVSATEKHYAVDDWTIVRATGSPVVTPYVVRKFNDLIYEIERYVVLPSAGSGAEHYLYSNEIPLHIKDKISFSVDWRLSTDLSGSGSFTQGIAQIRLYGDDGTYWMLNSNPAFGRVGQWVASNSSFNTNIRFISDTWNRDQRNETEWATVSVESEPLPVNGAIRVFLVEHTVTGRRDVQFFNLKLTYIPFINGSYQKYSGQFNKVSQDINTKKRTEADVFISDSPKKLFKGALHRWNGTKYVLAGNFFDASLYDEGYTEFGQEHPYGWWQAFDVWFQYRYDQRVIDAVVQGLNSDGTAQEVLNSLQRFLLGDIHPHAAYYFQLLHYEADFLTCEWSGRIIANIKRKLGNWWSSDPDEILEGDHEFKYLTDRE